MFIYFGTFSSAGSNLLIPDCELSAMKTADLFFTKQIAFALLIPSILIICTLAWSAIAACRFRRFRHSSTINHIILSSVLMIFLAYPLLTRSILSMLKCPKVAERMFLMAE
jgi:hypothetical protein